MNNRLWNAKNPFQGESKKVLCVCSAGLLRSPTIAWILSNEPFNCNTRAVGSSSAFALIPIDDVLIEWADLIVFVEKDVESSVKNNFGDLIFDTNKTLITLDLPDNFEFKSEELIEIATQQLSNCWKEMHKKS